MRNIDINYLYGIYKDEYEGRGELMTKKEFVEHLDEKIEYMIRDKEID